MANNSPVYVAGGYLTIPEITDKITVNHNLGVVPNFAAIWVDGTDYDIIPFGSCVECTYQKNPYITAGSHTNINMYKYMYQYKHSTSGNLLSGDYFLYSNQEPTATVFNFHRGDSNWKALDTNGNPLRYRWVVGYLPISE